MPVVSPNPSRLVFGSSWRQCRLDLLISLHHLVELLEQFVDVAAVVDRFVEQRSHPFLH